MSVGQLDKISLLSAVTPREAEQASNRKNGGVNDRLFADRLDKILTGADGNTASQETRARVVAEALSLQMLHTTLSLSGEQPAPVSSSPLFSGQSALFRSVIDSYNSNKAGDSTVPFQSTAPSQPLPDADTTAVSSVSAKASSTSLKANRGGEWLDPLIARASSRYGVDAALIKAVIKAESGFNPNAVSHAGARGLMQLMPATARSLGVTDPFDPEQNVMAGTRFLRDLLNRYDGNLDSALAAYNWGPGNVDKRPDRLPRETREYQVRVKQLYSSYIG